MLRAVLVRGIVLALAMGLLLPVTAAAARCSWGGTSTVPAPTAVPLRSLPEPVAVPGRVAADGAGHLFVTDSGAGRVVELDAFGHLVSVKEGLSVPIAVAVDDLGSIYVAEAGAGRVVIYDRDWSPVGVLGQGDGELVLPTDIAIDPVDGRVFVSDGGANEVRVFSSAGSPLSSFGGLGKGLGQLDFPAAVHVDAQGVVFVADQNNDRIQVFDRSGASLLCFGGGGMMFGRRFGRVQGLTTDSQGRLYVVDAFQGHVQVFDRQGALLGVIGRFGTGAGELRTPVGLAIDRFGRLFVASANNGRLEVFGIDDFADPSLLTAEVEVEPDKVELDDLEDRLELSIRLPEPLLELVLPASITANGVPVDPPGSEREDDEYEDDEHERDHEEKKLRVEVDARAVIEGLEPGPGTIGVQGELRDGRVFVGEGRVTIEADGEEHDD